MRNSLRLTGTLESLTGMNRPTNVSFDGILVRNGRETLVISTHVEQLLAAYMCTKGRALRRLERK